MKPGDSYEYDGEDWTISMVNSSYFTIEKGKKWLTLKRK
jgi:hypothetical protein